MARESTKFVVRKLIKAYLSLNKGREITAKEIADWINENNFGLKTDVKSRAISRLIKESKWNNGSILYGVEIIQSHPHRYILR